MHPAGIFHEAGAARLAALVADRGLALIVGARGDRSAVAHAPVLLDGDRLRFHLSAANALCPLLRANPWALAVVTGPDAYISPDWYAAAEQVPTWNYVSAEIEGRVEALSRLRTARLLDDLSAHFEARLAPKPPWSPATLSSSTFEKMLGAIVGFEMRIERLSGISKLSQNKPGEERGRVAHHLREQPDEGARRMARLMGGD